MNGSGEVGGFVAVAPPRNLGSEKDKQQYQRNHHVVVETAACFGPIKVTEQNLLHGPVLLTILRGLARVRFRALLRGWLGNALRDGYNRIMGRHQSSFTIETQSQFYPGRPCRGAALRE